MKEILDTLKTRYQAVLESGTDSLFYDNVHKYIDWIVKTPKLNEVIVQGAKEYGIKHRDIWKNKTGEIEDSKERTRQTYKLEKFSLYASNYIDLEMFIYFPLEEYKTTNEPDYLQDPFALMLLNGGYKKLPLNKWRKLAFENNRPDLWGKENLKEFDIRYKGKRKYYKNKVKQFHADFLTEISRVNTQDSFETQKEELPLKLNFRTGEFTYCKTSGTIPLKTKEFKVLSLFLYSKDYFADYLSLCKATSLGITEVRKAHKDELAQTIKDLKIRLKILPKTKTSNPDIFKVIKKVGYQLIFKAKTENTE
jgi:hypothetical protein